MPYVNAQNMLKNALEGHYAVGQFNLNNLECIGVFMKAAEELHAPIMLGVSGNIAKKMGGYRVIADVTRGMIDAFDISVPVCLHADHGTYEQALAAINSGFSSVMFDGSHDTLEENLRKTETLVQLCHKRGITLEAEVGAVAGTEDGVTSLGECADPEDCRRIAQLGVDFLAAGIGNIHGQYPADWQGLQFGVLQSIRKATGNLPLVLHGGSGIPEEMIRQAISMGISKINVNTECRIAFDAATRAFIEQGLDTMDKNHTKLITMEPGLLAVKECCMEKIRMFGADGKA